MEAVEVGGEVREDVLQPELFLQRPPQKFDEGAVISTGCWSTADPPASSWRTSLLDSEIVSMLPTRLEHTCSKADTLLHAAQLCR